MDATAGEATSCSPALQAAIDHKDPESTYLRARDCDLGQGVRQDRSEALRGYRKVWGRFSEQAEFRIAQMYLTGQGTSIDYALAWEYFRRAADMGNAQALLQMGLMQEQGLGREADQNKALELMAKAASRSEASGQAAGKLLRAAEAGNVEAQYLVAMYFIGKGTTRMSNQEHVRWLTKAANGRHLPAQRELGRIYDRGMRGIKKDRRQAFQWTARAAENGDLLASIRLAHMYEHGRGVAADPVRAVAMYEKAARMDYDGEPPDAYRTMLAYLGQLYFDGTYVKQDYQAAFHWWKLASGFQWAPLGLDLKLGLMQLYGVGTPRNPEQAVVVLRRAQTDKLFSAAYFLGLAYEHGWGVEQDVSRAVDWYREGSVRKDDCAFYGLGRMTRDGTGITRNYPDAIKWFREAAKQGHGGAKRALSELYRKGQGVKKNPDMARQLEQEASTLDSQSVSAPEQYCLNRQWDWKFGFNDAYQ